VPTAGWEEPVIVLEKWLIVVGQLIWGFKGEWGDTVGVGFSLRVWEEDDERLWSRGKCRGSLDWSLSKKNRKGGKGEGGEK